MARGELPLKRKAKIQQNERPNKRQIVEPVESVKKEEDDDMMDPERDAISSKDPSSMGKILLPEDRPQKKCVYFMKGRYSEYEKESQFIIQAFGKGNVTREKCYFTMLSVYC
ncbi:hypothetical protein G6F56_012945 [Rhizopus delemar]|nr:hypothetical protein G6F56_012945 [Rhizopus delemar]